MSADRWVAVSMGVIRAALCDDEPSWLEQSSCILGAYGEQSGHQIELARFADGTTMLRDCPWTPDVLFCDIELGPNDNGIDLVREVARTWPTCQIVYVTNFLRYAPDVYVTEHLWFVLKDTLEQRLPEVMEKLLRQMEDGSQVLAIQTTEHGMLAIPCGQIALLERRRRVTIVTCSDGTSYTVPDRISALLERLPKRLFAQSHGSYVVGLSHVRMVMRDSITLNDGINVPLSRRYARGFRDGYLDWVDDHAL